MNGPSPAAKRLALLWAGTLLGVSFIATPAKFQAPDLSLPVALEVGRATFRAVGIVEFVFATLLIAILAKARTWSLIAILPVLLLALEWVAVMPFLDAATVAVIQGKATAGGSLHVAFIAVECVKLGALMWMGLASPQQQAIDISSANRPMPRS